MAIKNLAMFSGFACEARFSPSASQAKPLNAVIPSKYTDN
jgi:hypothetical protein